MVNVAVTSASNVAIIFASTSADSRMPSARAMASNVASPPSLGSLRKWYRVGGPGGSEKRGMAAKAGMRRAIFDAWRQDPSGVTRQKGPGPNNALTAFRVRGGSSCCKMSPR